MPKRVPPKPRKFPAGKQQRLDQLLDKNREGTISRKERAALEQLVSEAEDLMLANARRLATFAKASGENVRSGSVPVTVWVQPQGAEH